MPILVETTVIKSRSVALALALALALVLVSACSEPVADQSHERADADRRLSVYVVNDPLKYFAERIGGKHVDVMFPAPTGADPAFWQPSPEIVAAYQGADLILENGAGYAAWLRHATLPRTSRVDTSAAFADRLIEQGGAVTHGHGPKGEHSHTDMAFTTWLDPVLATLQARAIADAMIERRPDVADDLRHGLGMLEADLRELDASLQRATEPLRDRPVLFSHPVYQYFARRYGLTGRSLHWEPGQLPDASEWPALESWLAKSPANLLFFEADPHPEVEARLRSLGVRTIVLAPGGSQSDSSDWLRLMQENVGRIEQVHAAAPSRAAGGSE